MILPIVAYGDPVLKKKAVNVEKQHLKLKELLRDMWETMYAAYGVGLAAPQIGESLRLFIVDGSPFAQDKSLDHYQTAPWHHQAQALHAPVQDRNRLPMAPRYHPT